MKKVLFRLTAALLALSVLLSFAAAAEEGEAAQPTAVFTTADLMDATIADMLAAMEDGRLTSERLTQMYLDRIEAYDLPMELRTIINLNPDALAEARKADQTRAKGGTGRLLGIPILVKDSIDVAGLPTTNGSYLLKNAFAASDAEAVARLRAEGAVILGKTNMSTFSQSGSNTISEIAGMVGNAYDPTRTPAGSSGGSAVAVACCFCAAALGDDTYVSLRRPASFAGVYTIRSSFGMVSQIGLTRLNFDQDVIGPLCRNAEDMALLFDIIAGTDPADPYTAEADSYLPQGGYLSVLDADGLAGKRIGYLANSFGYLFRAGSNQPAEKPQPLDPTVSGMVDRTKQLLIDAGAELVDLSDELTEHYIASVNQNDAPSNMLAIRQHVTDLLRQENIDAVIYVSQNNVAETQANPVGKYDNLSGYIYTFSPLGGLPEITLPMGLSETDPENGVTHPMPLGLSMFAGYGNDDVLLQIAYAYDQIADVKTHPWTTPALPDENLAAYGKQLLEQAGALERDGYAEESLAAVDAAAQALASMQMGDGADVEAYQAAADALSLALNGLQAAAPETTEPPEATEGPVLTEQPTEQTTATEESETREAVSAKDLLPRSTRFPWELPVIVAAVLWGLFFWYKRRFGNDDDY